MPQEDQTKTCKVCCMEIPSAAKKCPYCHHWQRWVTLYHPLTMTTLIFVPMLVVWLLLIGPIQTRFREGEPFAQYAAQVKILDSKMEFGEDDCGPAVVIVGRVDNQSPLDWKDVRFQVNFFDPEDQLFDSGQQETYTWRFPAGQESSFKVSFRRQFPQERYARYQVSLVTAVDSREWP